MSRYPNEGPGKDQTIGAYAARASENELLHAQYRDFLAKNDKKIVELAVLKVNRYINLYRVSPTEGVLDELKSIYFLGMTIAELLDRVGLGNLSRIQMKAVVFLLDYRLLVPHRAARRQLTERLITAIDDGNLTDHFGEFGLYITYKCLLNSLTERSEESK